MRRVLAGVPSVTHSSSPAGSVNRPAWKKTVLPNRASSPAMTGSGSVASWCVPALVPSERQIVSPLSGLVVLA